MTAMWTSRVNDRGYLEVILEGVPFIRCRIEEMEKSSMGSSQKNIKDPAREHRFHVTINGFGVWDRSRIGDEHYRTVQEAKEAALGRLKNASDLLRELLLLNDVV